METSKIKSCRFLKSYDSKFGTMYAHFIELANGDCGEISAKNEMPAKFAPGQELTYELTPNPNPKYAAKIKAVNPKFGGNAKPNDTDGFSKQLQSLRYEIAGLKETIKILVKENRLKYVAPKAEVKQHAPLTYSQVDSISDINPPDSDLPF